MAWCFVIISVFSDIPDNFMHLSRKLFSRIFCALAVVALAVLTSCGGGNNSSSTPPTSKFKNRVLAMESFFGRVAIVNADNDLVWPATISVLTNSDGLVLSPDKANTYVFGSTVQSIRRIVNSTETLDNFSITVPAGINSFGVLSGNATGVAASRNAPVTGSPIGAVLLLDFTNQNITATIPVAEARRVVLNHANSKVLAFADDTDSFYVIDTTAKTATPITNAAKLSRPVGAVFSTDDSKAYILNCGAECGGTTASVTVFNTADSTLGATIPVSGATVGLLDGSKLYVAGSANNVGLLDVVDTSAMTRTQSGISISNGTHNLMALADGGNLYIGAINCSNVNGGCLTTYPTSGQTATVSSVIGDVSAIQPVAGRGLVYVGIGGDFKIYETSTNAPRATGQINVLGNVTAIMAIDK